MSDTIVMSPRAPAIPRPWLGRFLERILDVRHGAPLPGPAAEEPISDEDVQLWIALTHVSMF